MSISSSFISNGILSALHNGQKSLNRLLAALVAVMYVATAVYFVGFWDYLQEAFVNHAGSEEDTLVALARTTQATYMVSCLSCILLALLGDCFLVRLILLCSDSPRLISARSGDVGGYTIGLGAL